MKLHLKLEKDDEGVVYLADHWLEITEQEATDAVIKNIKGAVAEFSTEQKQALSRFLDEWDFNQAMDKKLPN